MTVTQSYSDIETGAEDNFWCGFAPNVGTSELISTVTVTLPTSMAAVGAPKIGRIEVDPADATKYIFTEDPLGHFAEQRASVAGPNGSYFIKWLATTDAGRKIPVTYGIIINPRS